jgi:hypothetical protein
MKLVTILLLLGGLLAASSRTHAPPAAGPLGLEPLPLHPIPDSRQLVRYYSSTPHFILLLTDSGATLVFPASVVRIDLRESNPKAAIEGDPAPSSGGPFVGNASGSPSAKVGSYTRVRYRDIYPGIDLVFRGDNRQIQHDFLVAPGADPHHIHLRFEGADRIFIDDDGSLVVHAGGTELSISPPVAYQDLLAAPARRRVPVEARYVMISDAEVGFSLGPYDRTQPLTID